MSNIEVNDVEVKVATAYVPERSNPDRGLYFYAYNVTITNRGSMACQLLSRHWIITDALGNVEQVKGPGVVGETPWIEAGQSYSYTSFCPLRTPVGSMQGSYQMVDADGQHFDAEIPAFTLVRDGEVN